MQLLSGNPHVEICGTIHARLGPKPRPIAHRSFCSGMWRPVQGSSPPWLTKLGVLGPSSLAWERYYAPGEGRGWAGGGGTGAGAFSGLAADLAHPTVMLPLAGKLGVPSFSTRPGVASGEAPTFTCPWSGSQPWGKLCGWASLMLGPVRDLLD